MSKLRIHISDVYVDTILLRFDTTIGTLYSMYTYIYYL